MYQRDAAEGSREIEKGGTKDGTEDDTEFTQMIGNPAVAETTLPPWPTLISFAGLDEASMPLLTVAESVVTWRLF